MYIMDILWIYMPVPFVACGDFNLKHVVSFSKARCIFLSSARPLGTGSCPGMLAQHKAASPAHRKALPGAVSSGRWESLRDIERCWGPFFSVLQAVNIGYAEGQTMTLELLWWWFCFFELVRSSLFLRSAFVCCTSVTPSPRCSWQSESWCQVLSTDRCERSESNRQLYGNGARREHFASWHYPSCGNRSTQSHCMLSIVEWEFIDFNGLSTPLMDFQRLWYLGNDVFFLLDSFSFFSPRSSIADFVPNIGNIFSGFGNLFRWQKANWIRAVRELLPERQNEVRQVCLARL